jgi:hypothetical protein
MMFHMPTNLDTPPWWLVIAFLLAVPLVNIAGWLASSRDLVGGRFEGALAASVVAILVSTFTGWMVLFAAGVLTHLALGLYVAHRLRGSRPARSRHSRR